MSIGNRLAPLRFLLFCAVLALATALGWAPLGPTRAFMVGFDVATLAFLAALAPLLRQQVAGAMRQHALANDANRRLLLIVATIVALAILLAVGAELNGTSRPQEALVIATLALAWLFANTVYALHYAHLYYAGDAPGGLQFAGDPGEPDYSDFLYFAFTLGMTFQTSDTTVTSRAMRQVVTWHSLAAFVFNLGVLAFSINVLGGG